VAPGSGGLRTALRELGAGYLAAGHEPVLIVPGRAAADEMTAQGRVITLRGPQVPWSGGYRVLLCRRRLAGLLESLRPDRLEVSDRTTLRWTGPWARRHGVPAVMVSHESVAGLLGLAGLRGGWAADALNRRTARQYRRVICTTRWAAAEFDRVEARNVVRAPLGVDLKLFSPERYSAAYRARFAAPEETLIVHCGRLSAEKKPHRSLDALAALRADSPYAATLRTSRIPISGIPGTKMVNSCAKSAHGPDLRAVLVVAGDGPLRRRLELRARAEGLPVRFIGFLQDRTALATLLASADVAIAPGPVETFGLAALEALACGTPVVVSASSALPEVIGAAGVSVTGEDFASGVHTVLERSATAQRATARARAEEFGWPAAVAAFLAVHTGERHNFDRHDLAAGGGKGAV
jgi:alpha-1,6-mannosyltransferase